MQSCVKIHSYFSSCIKFTLTLVLHLALYSFFTYLNNEESEKLFLQSSLPKKKLFKLFLYLFIVYTFLKSNR